MPSSCRRDTRSSFQTTTVLIVPQKSIELIGEPITPAQLGVHKVIKLAVVAARTDYSVHRASPHQSQLDTRGADARVERPIE